MDFASLFEKLPPSLLSFIAGGVVVGALMKARRELDRADQDGWRQDVANIAAMRDRLSDDLHAQYVAAQERLNDLSKAILECRRECLQRQQEKDSALSRLRETVEQRDALLDELEQVNRELAHYRQTGTGEDTQ